MAEAGRLCSRLTDGLVRRGLSIVADRFRTSDFGLGEQPDLADGQHVGDATLAFFGGPGSLDQSPSTLTRLPLVKPSSATSAAPSSSQTLALKKIVATSGRTAYRGATLPVGDRRLGRSRRKRSSPTRARFSTGCTGHAGR